VSKTEGKFFEAPETVWWFDLTDPDLPPYFATDLRYWPVHCAVRNSVHTPYNYAMGKDVVLLVAVLKLRGRRGWCS